MKKEDILQYLDNPEVVQDISNASDKIWDNPELAFNEHVAVETLCGVLEKYGFQVKKGYGDLDTAFTGTFGKGKPVIGILGEFDALSNLNQSAGKAVQEAFEPGGSGHGCGHNLLGAGSLAAAIGIKEYLEKNGKEGTVVYFGCPGEEGGSGKAFMARDGVFDDLDCALTWHPGAMNMTAPVSFLANYQIEYHFTGVSAHAAASPHLGRSALDAVELMNMGVQFLREHIITSARVHYAITDTGGMSPNVVQPNASVLYLIRAPKTPQVQDIYERVNRIAQGAAMMTDTKVDIEFVKACSNIVPNSVLTKMLQQNMEETPLPEFDGADWALAESMVGTMDKAGGGLGDRAALYSKDQLQFIMSKAGKAINNFVMPLTAAEPTLPGSTDVGDVSWVCPTAQISAVTEAAGTAEHSWQMVAQGKSGIAHKGMFYAAKVMAGTAIDLFENPDKVQAAKEELKTRLGGGSYVPPIPKDVKPRMMGK